MVRFWSYEREYKRYKNSILNKIDKTIKKGNIFFGQEINNFEKVDAVLNRMTKKENTYILGTGFTASCFLFYSKKIKKIKLKGIFDNSNEKESKEFLNFKIQKPNYDKLVNGSNIIVATIGSVKEIMKSISKSNKNRLNFYIFDEKYNFVKI